MGCSVQPCSTESRKVDPVNVYVYIYIFVYVCVCIYLIRLWQELLERTGLEYGPMDANGYDLIPTVSGL